MKRSWGIIASLLLFAGCHTSKKPVLYELHEQVDVDVAALQEKYPLQESAYMFYKHEISHDLKPDVTSNAPRWYYFEAYHWKEVVLENEAEPETRYVEFDLGPDEKIRYFKARVTRPGEKASLYGKKALDKTKRDGGTSYMLDVEGLAEGASIEVALEVERGNLLKAPPVSHDVPLQLDKPVEYLEFGYTYPEDWSVQVKQLATHLSLDMTESVDKRAESKRLSYSGVNVPAYHKEPYGPHFKQIAPYFHVKVSHVEVGNVLEEKGAGTWEVVAARHGNVMGSSRKTRDRARKKVQRLGIDGAMSEQEKMTVILAHVQKDITVTEKHRSGDVWRKKVGNPMQVTQYTRSLFEAADIKTDILLSHTALDGYFDESFVSDEQMNTPVLRAHVSGNPVFLFPAEKGVPVGYIPAHYASQVALLYTDQGYEGIATIPPSLRRAYKDDGSYDLFVNGEGEVRAEVILELGQHSTFAFNQALLQSPDEEASLVGKLLAHHSEHISMLSYTLDTEREDQTLSIRASYSLDDCVAPENDIQVIESCGLFEPINKEWHPFTASRSMPFVVPGDLDITNNIRVIYPEAWTVSSAVQNVAQNRERVLFERTHSSRPGEVVINQHLIVKENTFSPSQNTFLASAIRLPLGTSLSGIALSSAPQLAAAPRVIATRPGGPWTLIVSSMESYDEAVNKVQELERSDDIEALPVRILGNGPIEDRYHVLLGMFSSRTEVETARIMLAKQIPYDAWIAAVNPQMTAVLTNTAPITY